MVAWPLSLRLFICKSFIYLQPKNKQTNNPLTKKPPNNAVIISSLPMREVERERGREKKRGGEGGGGKGGGEGRREGERGRERAISLVKVPGSE